MLSFLPLPSAGNILFDQIIQGKAANNRKYKIYSGLIVPNIWIALVGCRMLRSWTYR